MTLHNTAVAGGAAGPIQRRPDCLSRIRARRARQLQERARLGGGHDRARRHAGGAAQQFSARGARPRRAVGGACHDGLARAGGRIGADCLRAQGYRSRHAGHAAGGHATFARRTPDLGRGCATSCSRALSRILIKLGARFAVVVKHALVLPRAASVAGALPRAASYSATIPRR
jgi:hypothetical protein